MTSWRSKHVTGRPSRIKEWWYISIDMFLFTPIVVQMAAFVKSWYTVIFYIHMANKIQLYFNTLLTKHSEQKTNLTTWEVNCHQHPSIALYTYAKNAIRFTVFFHLLSWRWSTKELGPSAIYDQHIKLIVLCIVPNFIHILIYQKLYSGENENWFELVQIHSSDIICLKG